ncbi:M20/M25/M40 family metallo-hydrolase [Acidobacteria bacterium ACD]|nr:MAG: M20/M25/M40 family metallo-hydrolase [Acidobacteriota bacterium]MDL1951105.1 M20/M25/M40 family metallo-hydrolase [Acidobacteria bacterium ACD]
MSASRPRPSAPRAPAALLVRTLLAAALAAAGPSRAELPVPPLSRAATRLAEYVRIDTSNPPGREKAGTLFLKAVLDEAGIPSETHETAPGRPSLYARLRGTTGAPGLLLHHHVDVVPAGGAGWDRPPFAGERNGYRLVGRGTLDDKSLGVAQLEAFLAVAALGKPPARDLVLLASVDEEAGGLAGLGRLARERPEWFRGIGDAIGEGGTVEVVVDRARWFGVETAQKGALWLRLSAAGKGGHAAVPDGGNPAERIVAALARVTAFASALPLRLTPEAETGFAARTRVPRKTPAPTVAALREALRTDPARLRGSLPPPDLALLSDTVALTRLGSDAAGPNAIARSAFAELDCRLLPGTDPRDFLARLRAAVADRAVGVEVLLDAPGGPATSGGELLDRIASAMSARHPGVVVGGELGAGLSENRVLRSLGIRTYGLTPFRVNYYDQAGIHGVNEQIRVDWFDEGVEVLKGIVVGHATAPSPPPPPRAR